MPDVNQYPENVNQTQKANLLSIVFITVSIVILIVILGYLFLIKDKSTMTSSGEIFTSYQIGTIKPVEISNTSQSNKLYYAISRENLEENELYITDNTVFIQVKISSGPSNFLPYKDTIYSDNLKEDIFYSELKTTQTEIAGFSGQEITFSNSRFDDQESCQINEYNDNGEVTGTKIRSNAPCINDVITFETFEEAEKSHSHISLSCITESEANLDQCTKVVSELQFKPQN